MYDVCYARKYVYFCIFIMFKSLPGLDLRRFVYPHTFSMNGTPIRLMIYTTINNLGECCYICFKAVLYILII